MCAHSNNTHTCMTIHTMQGLVLTLLNTHAFRYMIASVLLVAGLFCWLCAYTDDAYFHTKDNFGIAVLPLMIPSLALFAFKARTYLQKPYLSLPNWFLYVQAPNTSG